LGMFDAAALVLEEIAPEDKNRNEVRPDNGAGFADGGVRSGLLERGGACESVAPGIVSKRCRVQLLPVQSPVG
jgi:hypothetical protein